MKRREFLKGMATITASAAVFPSLVFEGCSSRRKPNIIFILADDLGYGDLGCYQQKQIRTPNLDKMASEGIRFTQHYAGSTVCAPSRFTLMTGFHIGHARTAGQGQVLQPDDTTVASMLQNAGYHTACFGKWGLGEEESTGAPWKQGFDEFFGYLNQGHAHNYYAEFLWRNDNKISLDNEVVQSKAYNGMSGVATKRVDYSHDLFVQEALEFIAQHKNEPFFLYLPFTIPHANNQAQARTDGKGDPGWTVIPESLPDHRERQGMEVPDAGQYQDKPWPGPQKGTAAMISRMDRDIGRILEHLRKYDLDQHTLVMFSSDNGPHKEGGNDPEFFDSNGPLRGIKRDLYDGGIRVPFIARWPGQVPAGSVSEHISAFWDFLPTCAEVAGVEMTKQIDGISMLPTLQGIFDRQKQHEMLYWEFKNSQALRMDDWKLICTDKNAKNVKQMQLYNLAEELSEQLNVAEQHPEIVAKMLEIMPLPH